MTSQEQAEPAQPCKHLRNPVGCLWCTEEKLAAAEARVKELEAACRSVDAFWADELWDGATKTDGTPESAREDGLGNLADVWLAVRAALRTKP